MKPKVSPVLALFFDFADEFEKIADDETITEKERTERLLAAMEKWATRVDVRKKRQKLH
jgi:hypothetical protein